MDLQVLDMVGAQQAAYDRVCRDLGTPESRSPNTLHLLRTLLDLQPKTAPKKPVTSRSGTNAASKRPPATLNPTRKPTKTKNPPTFDIHDDLASEFEPLEVKKRKKLATFVFNAALKQLSDAAKDRTIQNIGASPETTKTTKSTACAQSQHKSQPGHHVNSGAKKPADRVRSLLLVSKCASIALDCLRVLGEECHGTDFVDDHLENGGMIILDKSITLELHDTAEYESRRLYEQYWKRRKEQRPCQGLYDRFLLGREESEAGYKFATSLQGQLLRLAILKGVTALRDGFSECFDPNSVGSPAWMLTQGNRDGFLDPEACGNQLRTISLALSKLHTLIDQGQPLTLRIQGLQLASTALQVKCMSWKYLGHEPDFARELWTPLSRAIKRAMEAVEDKAVVRAKAQACLDCIQTTLSHLGLKSTAPSALQSYCGKTCSIKPLQTKSHNTEPTERSLGVTLILNDSILTLDKWEADPESAINAAHECQRALRNEVGTLHAHDSSLIAMTRVRKSATVALDAIANSQPPPARHEELQVSLIGLICAMVGFCCRSTLQHPVPSATLASCKESGILLTYAKTIETVFQQESLPVANRGALEDEMHRSLHDCVALATAVRPRLNAPGLGESTREFLNAVPVRVSHVLWKRHRSCIEHCRPVAVRIGILCLSIDVLKDVSSEEKKTALLGLKHERLAHAYIEDRIFSKAQASLSSSIQFYIDQNKRRTACDVAKDDHSQHELQAALLTEGLDQSLKSYVQLSVDHDFPNGRGCWWYDDSQQHNFVRALLLQKQILLALHHCVQIKPSQISGIIQLWEQLCIGPEFLSHRLGAISCLLDILTKRKECNVVDLLKPLKTIQEIESHPPDHNTLTQISTLQHLLVSAQWSFATCRMDEKWLTAYVLMLPAVSEQLETWTLSTASKVDQKILSASIRALADLAGMYGLTHELLKFKEFLSVLLPQTQPREEDRKAHVPILLLLEISMLKLELNDTVGAGKALASAEQALQTHDPMLLEWLLSKAEYHLVLGNLGKSKETLDGATDHFAPIQKNAPAKARLDQQLQLCRAALLTSKLARQMGNLALATRFARQAVKISSSVWSSLEEKLRSSGDLVSNGNESSLHNLTQDMSNLTIVEPIQQEASRLYEGSRYWTLVSLHRSVLRNAADVSSHNGLYQDAVYFAQQASKITAWTGGQMLREAVNSELALIYANAAEHDKASQLLSASLLPSQDDSFESYRTLLNYAEALIQIGSSDRAVSQLQTARQRLVKSRSDQSAASKASSKTVARTRSTKVAAKYNRKSHTPGTVNSLEPPPGRDQISLESKTLQARLNALENKLQYTRGLPKNHKSLPCNVAALTPVELVSQAIVFLQDALKQFAMDPSNNTICETALALPVRYRHVRKSGQMSLVLEQSPHKPRSPIAAPGRGSDILVQACDCLRSVEMYRLPLLSSARVELLHKALSQVMLLSTAACTPLNYTPINVVLQSLRPKDVSRSREQFAIASERHTATHEQIHQWPITGEVPTPDEDWTELTHKLPKSWIINSIGLSHDSKELLLSRIVSESSPFLMRVPLERPGLDDDEPCEFTLDYAKQELQDIIKKANDSCHDSRGQGDKQTRKAWYSEREHLDKRLELLLANIENIWFGGFRGLLSPTSTDQPLLARFGESLTHALDKHLPTRQKKSKSQSRIELHAHVLELFTSIKFNESHVDFEDSVTDLLYFVVDILQFNGERNAFDEIDFDALLLDTVDALRGYHTAHSPDTARHTILVIDKELQSFPWESMPCLRGHPVSRMPSLGAIRDRLKHMDPDIDTYIIHPTSGAYILNPSSDLLNTQSTFAPLLQPLHPHFRSIVNRAPTESEFQSLLTTHSVLLYFGHGAGTQYIRGRTIRSLSNCAVTWLMGCSSAKLNECGSYESYGTPWHYMHAGSPAMVGTLWDVTDRDIDRFAVSALGSWGLLDTGAVEDKFWGPPAATAAAAARTKTTTTTTKGKGKKTETGTSGANGGGGGGGGGSHAMTKAKTEKEQQRQQQHSSLDQAVATARDACNLRYLNGAAPVVYGVPVSLAQ